MIGNYWTIGTGGWHGIDNALPNVFEVGTGGWFTAAGEPLPVTASGMGMDLAVMYQMGIGFGGR